LKLAERIARWFAVPVLTPARIVFALAVAVGTDVAQVLLGPFGAVFFLDEALDLVAMLLTIAAVGFHVLLLPTFVIELLPVADWLPTWTGCTAAVVLLRKRGQSQATPTPPVIDIPAEVSSTPVGGSGVQPAAKSRVDGPSDSRLDMGI
jgi:hypothetical protein